MDEYICRYCGRVCKNPNSLRNHERLCKDNPDRQIIKSNFIEWNRKRKELGIPSLNQFTKARNDGKPIPVVSEETRRKISERATGRPLTDEHKKHISDGMKIAVSNNPEKYNTTNIHTRIKHFWYNGQWMDGTWELEFAKYLESENIEWIKNSKWFEYEWNGSRHKYFPDFYLPKYDRYVEVKGYERERDREKYKVVDGLIVVRLKEIERIRKGLYNIHEYLE